MIGRITGTLDFSLIGVLAGISAVLAENQRQSAANSTARLEAIDRASGYGKE